ncbi:hypothetical protein [Rheinheimera pacifica]|uniref:hypothetical protein n=1 Tax=Rheinheimera pacifica TaxID=173990 RepID=UPI002ED874B0
MNKRYSFMNPEMIIAGSALTVSLITAFVSIYSAFIDRAYARASVWPRLEIQMSYNNVPNKASFSYFAANKGTGPAVIKYARLTYDNQPIKRWSDYLTLRIGHVVSHSQSPIGFIVLSAGETSTPLHVLDAEAAKQLTENDTLQIELCYCSIYDECWLVDRTNEPKPVAQCGIDEKQRFLQ